ncbi:sushi domain-containing protein 3-like [Leptodactylus fuscus]|uniref:sushi domain-containing protein 3-like n=1 Tax=Leptodactylus fuscus TaxID=238119 RepID=UPI003F4E6C8D
MLRGRTNPQGDSGNMIRLIVYMICLTLPGINTSGDANGGNKTLAADIPVTYNTSGAALCPVLTAPSGGSFHIFDAAERSLGSVALFSCQEGFQLMGHYKLRCQKKGHGLQWSHQKPQCQAISLTAQKGFRLAVIISLVSCFLIITLFVAFTVCCIRERQLGLQEETASALRGPGGCVETSERLSSSGYYPNPLRESSLYPTLSSKGPNEFENCGFQT